MMKKTKIATVWVLTVILLIFVRVPLLSAQSMGGIAVSPKRIVFENRKRSQEVFLFNNSAKPATYRVTIRNLRLHENGEIEEITSPGPGERFADHMIRYSPRQITIPPGGSQTVRFLVRKPKDLPPGEYRSHIFFQSLPPKDAGTDIETLDLKEREIALRLIPRYAVSIPVIVRQGALSAKVKISDLGIESVSSSNKQSLMAIHLNRFGDRSVYGDLKVYFQPSGSKKGFEIGTGKGIGVLSPLKTKKVRVPLFPKGRKIKDGKIHVLYRAKEEQGGQLLAKASLNLP